LQFICPAVIVIIIIIIIIIFFWPAGINPVGTKTLEKEMKIMNYNWLAGSELALE